MADLGLSSRGAIRARCAQRQPWQVSQGSGWQGGKGLARATEALSTISPRSELQGLPTRCRVPFGSPHSPEASARCWPWQRWREAGAGGGWLLGSLQPLLVSGEFAPSDVAFSCEWRTTPTTPNPLGVF